jgi:hypothetical protein
MTPEYLAESLTPFPLPTTDGWMLRTIGDTGAYILALRWLDVFAFESIISARRWRSAQKLEEE